VTKGRLDWVDFRESWLVGSFAYAGEVQDAEEGPGEELDNVEFTSVEEADEEGGWGLVDWCRCSSRR
jgi:hypothetical protein